MKKLVFTGLEALLAASLAVWAVLVVHDVARLILI